ncbi:Hint domain-containing protein [Tabrizicola sp.]|uniref:Hint domain-containing protein n=1 Tax=Tabrizicola sp. TaxID=2005166 RepID=UPI002FDDFA87
MDADAPFSRSAGGAGTEPAPGILAGTRVRTLEGILPVEYLTPGDRIVTRAGARRLTSISVVARKMVDLVRIRASTMGHDRPDQDLFLSPGQPVVIRDWRAQALYGLPAAAIPAARLADGEFVCLETHRQVRLFTLRFDDEEVIYAEGLELACPAFLPELA